MRCARKIGLIIPIPETDGYITVELARKIRYNYTIVGKRKIKYVDSGFFRIPDKYQIFRTDELNEPLSLGWPRIPISSLPSHKYNGIEEAVELAKSFIQKEMRRCSRITQQINDSSLYLDYLEPDVNLNALRSGHVSLEIRLYGYQRIR